MKADVAKNAEVRRETLPCHVINWLTYLTNIVVRQVTKQNHLFPCRNAVHILVDKNILAKQVLWNPSLIVTHLPEIVSVTIF